MSPHDMFPGITTLQFLSAPSCRAGRMRFGFPVDALSSCETGLHFARKRYGEFSECVAVGLAGADAHGVVDRRDKNLAIADLAGPGAAGDDVDDLVGDV